MQRRRISLRKGAQAFTCHVKQLEQFIVSQGLHVPEPGPRHASIIDPLIATYSSESSDGIPSVAQPLSSACRGQPQSQSDEAMIVQQSQPHASENPSFFGDVSGNYTFGYISDDEQMNLPTDLI